MDKTLLHTTMLSAVNAYEPSELISRIVGTDIATCQEARPPEVDMFAQTFSVAGEDQEKVADKETAILLRRFEGNPDVEKGKVNFDRAQEVEERFHKDFDGVDFASRSSGATSAFAFEIPTVRQE